MADQALERRLYQAFLRGYHESAAGAMGRDPGLVAMPCAFVIEAASEESKELRRSIDACRGALAQIDSLPDAEQDQLRAEARASLESLQAATDQLLERLRSLRPSDATGTAPVETARPTGSRAAAKRSRKPRTRR